MTRDLTSGSPLKTILQFAIPVLLGLLLQQVYSLVDTAIVGHALGVMALGGVGATSSVNFLVIGFSGGKCMPGKPDISGLREKSLYQIS